MILALDVISWSSHLDRQLRHVLREHERGVVRREKLFDEGFRDWIEQIHRRLFARQTSMNL